jgi:hypothetical protein
MTQGNRPLRRLRWERAVSVECFGSQLYPVSISFDVYSKSKPL